MIQVSPNLTTSLACKVVDLERDRFNEAVAGGLLPCAPATIAGRSRVFTPADMLILWYYRQLVADGYTRERAGRIACAITACAKRHPDAAAISYVESYFASAHGDAFPADQVPDHSKWESETFSGSNVRKVTTFNVGYDRQLLEHRTAEQLRTFGAED